MPASITLSLPTYWFAVLEIARERGRLVDARHALEQLRRLGINVRFLPSHRSRRNQHGGPHHAA